MARAGDRVRDRLALALFVGAAAFRTFALARFGRPPASYRLDGNNYLELALNLYRDGTYGSNVSTDYPPVYPMLIAPAFAFESNVGKFAAIYTIHGVLLALATLSLFPMLRSAMGARRAWICLAAAQFLAGTTFHAFATRTEGVFGAIVCFAVAAVWGAFQTPSRWRWVLVGVVCGIGIGCRRTGIVLPVGVGVVVVVEAWASAQTAGAALRRIAVRGAFLGVGLAIGLLPELVASMLHGGTIQTYHQGVVGSHLSPLTRMWASPARFWLALQTGLRQPLYGVVAFAGAPLVIAAILLRRKPVERPPVPLAAASGFALLVTLGLAAMSGLHILRYAYGKPHRAAYHLYPRYMDPAESGVILASVALAAWLASTVTDDTRERARTTLVKWALPVALLAWISGYAWRFRGGRIAPVWYFEGTPLEGWYHIAFVASVLVMLVALMAWWSLGKYGTVWTIVGAAAIGWAMSLHALVKPDRWDGVPPELPPILQSTVLVDVPRAPLAVPVRRRAHTPRGLYKVSFRSDHPTYWPALRELGAWIDEHPDGFVLTRSWEPDPGHRLRLELVGATRRWRLWAPIGREQVPEDLLDALQNASPDEDADEEAEGEEPIEEPEN